MNAIVVKVKNERLGLELNLHIAPSVMAHDFKNKTLTGHLQSFKSDKITDSLNAQNAPQAAMVTPISYTYETTENLEEQLEKYLIENIEKIASK